MPPPLAQAQLNSDETPPTNHLIGRATLENQSQTSVDRLVRQKLAGITVGSSLPTAGPASTTGLGSLEPVSKNLSAREDVDCYSLEVLKEKHARM